ncbi:MAG TPA: PAS domain-containing protein, partial [Coriobacteriia bacterium]|nr:PAS domain-containing protein [Coriobacteriia bacterium]
MHDKVDTYLALQTSALDAAADAIVAVNAEGEVTLWNKAAEQLYGVPATEAVGRALDESYRSLWPSPEAETAVWSTLKSEGLWRGIVAVTARDGERLEVEISASALRDGSGAPAGYIAVSRDVTLSRLREAEHELTRRDLRRESRMLRQMLDHIPVAVGLSDAEGRVLELNAYTETLWQGERPKARSKSEYRQYRAWWPATGKRVEPDEWTTSRALASGQPVHGDVMEIERFDGSHRYVLSSAVPITDEGQQLIGAVGIVEDITEQYERSELSSALNEISTIVHSSLDSETVLASVLEAAARAVKADEAGIAIREDEGWKPIHGYGTPQGILGRLFSDVEFPVATLAMQRRGIAREDDLDRELVGKSESFARTRSVLSSPLIVRDDVTGVITFQRHRTEPFTPAQQDFTRNIGSSLSLALENARLFEEQSERTALADALNTIDAEINETLDFDTALALSLPTAARVLAADAAAVMRVEGDDSVLASALNLEPLSIGASSKAVDVRASMQADSTRQVSA